MIIYKITNLVNNKSYIGLTTKTFYKRYNYRQDWWNASSINRLLKLAVDKYGSNNFKVEELISCFDKESLCDMEKYFIKFFNSLTPNGYNLTDGGEFFTPSDETKERNRLSHLGRISWNKGKKLTKQHINNLTQAKKRKYESGEIKPWNKGIKTGRPSEIAISNSAKGHYKPIKRIDLITGEEKIYEAIKFVENDGFKACSVCYNLKRNKSYKGYRWIYLNK